MKTKTIGICTLLATLILFPTIGSALAADYTGTVNITGNQEILTGQTTTLTATWSTNKDVTRYEWQIDGVSQGVVTMSDSQSGSPTFDFSSATAGTYVIVFRIWHHIQPRESSDSITITVSEPEQQEVQYSYETAFAYSEAANDFRDYGFSRWGWSNGQISDGYGGTWQLWAGAGQSDTDKGILVGSVAVTYSGGALNVNFNLDEGVVLQESHVYAGTGVFPLDHKGNPTVAPGQYEVASNLSGDIFVIVHAVIGIPVS